MMHSYPTCLAVHRLRIPVLLGYGKTEREKPQAIELEIKLFFRTLPPVFEDESASFICYDRLTRVITELTQGKEFKLIEYLAQQIFHALRTHIDQQPGIQPGQVALWLKLLKCVTPVPSILGGASITLTDLPEGLTFTDAG